MEVISRKEAKARGLKRYFTGKPCKHGHVAERQVCDNLCLECKRLYREANKERIAARVKACREANKEGIAKKAKMYREANKERIAARGRRWAADNKEWVREYKKDYHLANKEKHCARSRAYYESNKERVREYRKAHYEANKESILGRNKAWRDANKETEAATAREYYKANRERKLDIARKYRESNKDTPQYKASKCAGSMKRYAAKLQRTPEWADHGAIMEIYAEAQRLSEDTGIDFEVDHIIPLQGKLVSGLHVENNLQLLTRGENASKNNKFEPCIQLLA